LKLIPEHKLRWHDIQVVPLKVSRSEVRLDIWSLKWVRPFVACSPKEYLVDLNGERYKVAFNLRDDDHFIRRLEERTIVSPSNYNAKGQLFAFLYRWQWFDPIELPNGQWAARLWNWCDPKIPMAELWAELLGPTANIKSYAGIQFYECEHGRAHYLVGYCPIRESELSSGYAILSTLLLPGMDNTPEAACLKNGMSTVERCTFEKKASEQTMYNLCVGKDFSVVREYHAVVPQVRYIPEAVFDYGKVFQ
jgi:hypothetical protein